MKKAHKLAILVAICMVVAAIYLNEWSNYGPITIATLIFSFLVHIMAPVIIASVLIKSK